LPRKEQSRAESYTPGERIRAVIKGVNRSAKGPQIVLSRTHPALLINLFEQEVPEIYDGTVMIRGAVREAGDRAKVAVYSRERDVDPVGACVGMKGTRVQAIIRELRGEKIDIVEWSEDPVQLVTNALSPAKVQRVSIVDERDRIMEVVVEDKQLSLAIGKKGQNVRLAAKLTGWRIDIKSEKEKRREVEAEFGALGGETTAAVDDDTASQPAASEEEPAAAIGEGGAEGDEGETSGESVGPAEPRRRGGGRGRGGGAAGGARRQRRASRAWPGQSRTLRMRRGPAEAGHYIRKRFGNGSDIQGRGTARHDEPGSARAAQARSRNRAKERLEHDRGGCRALIRRAARATAKQFPSPRRHVRLGCPAGRAAPHEEGRG